MTFLFPRIFPNQTNTQKNSQLFTDWWVEVSPESTKIIIVENLDLGSVVLRDSCL